MENRRRRRKSVSRVAQISQAIKGRDLATLKHLARTGAGLETTRLRRRAWPLLLNFRSLVDPGTTLLHPDEAQVDLDVPRTGLPKSREIRCTEHAVQRRQKQLRSVVVSVLCSYPWLSYYQGFHELTMPFLCVFGSEKPTQEAMRMMALFFVRDAMSSSLDHVMQQLQLLYVLLKAIAPKVHTVLEELQVPPFFAISWVLTWFAHDVDEFASICRIYDFLVVSPPMQIVYVAAALVKHSESEILAMERDFAMVHTGLTKLPQQTREWDSVLEDSWYLQSEYPATKLQQMGCMLARRSAVNTFEATWTRLDPARPLPFTALVATKAVHPLAETTPTKSATKNATNAAQWPLVIATVASATMIMYAYLLAQP
ncbi:GTPase-activating protein gyp8 [Coemansia sp. RSA 1199]|nr:GTPase-activating protein gyp8 [Coemansia sp. RSA 1199]